MTFLVVLAVLVLGRYGIAAEIQLDLGDDGFDVLTVVGPLEFGDDVRFKEAVARQRGGVVLLASPGGNVRAGIEIGRAIRLRQLATGVVAGTECLSACALAWLGGSSRILQDGATVGFHAAFAVGEDGTARESGMANALVGAYLANLGYGEHVVAWATFAAPEQMLFLDEAVAREIGLDFVRLPVEDDPPAVGSGSDLTPRTSPSAVPVELAAAFVDRHFAQSAPRDGNPDYVFATYADGTRYFGEVLSRHEIVRRRAAYLERWPTSRVWRTGPSTITCDARDRCTISGPAAYEAVSARRNVRSQGTLTYAFEVERRGGRFVIVAEGSEVGSRRTGAVDGGNLTFLKSIQQELHRHGCDPGAIDGAWGGRSSAALGRFGNATGTYRRAPDAVTLQILRSTPAPACSGRAASASRKW